MSENSRQRHPPAPQYTEAITLGVETNADDPTIQSSVDGSHTHR
jgi:hypothetical protein